MDNIHMCRNYKSCLTLHFMFEACLEGLDLKKIQEMEYVLNIQAETVQDFEHE